MAERRAISVPIDTRVAVYRLTLQFVLIVLAGTLLRLSCFSIVTVRGSHMAPTLVNGDRVLVRHTLGAPSLFFGLAQPGTVVLARLPHNDTTRSFLRIAARSGDSVEIFEGRLVAPYESANPRLPDDSLLPPEYSPRDYVAPFLIPRTGTVYALDSLNQRDFVFVASIQAQQKPSVRYQIKPVLFVDEVPSSEYIVRNFHLYQGVFDSIPDSLRFDWFFWDRIRENLRFTLENRQVRLAFELFADGKRIDTVTIARPLVFLLADNWEGGLDSRYTGLVSRARIDGIAGMVLWSFGSTDNGRKRIKTDRFLKPVRRRRE